MRSRFLTAVAQSYFLLAATRLLTPTWPLEAEAFLMTAPGPSLRSSLDSDDPRAGDSSDSPGRPEMRYDEFILDGPCYFSRGDFLGHYGHLDGVTWWERATVSDSGDGADGSENGAGNAVGSDDDDDDAVGPHGNADYAAGSDVSADAVDGPAGSVAAYTDACRGPTPGRAGTPRTCLVCGETLLSTTTSALRTSAPTHPPLHLAPAQLVRRPRAQLLMLPSPLPPRPPPSPCPRPSGSPWPPGRPAHGAP